MKQFNTISDAANEILRTYGTDVLDNTHLFIALLSDYAPNLAGEQLLVRAFARADGLKKLLIGVKNAYSFEGQVAIACEALAQMNESTEKRQAVIEFVKCLLHRLNIKFSEADYADRLHNEGLSYFRKMPKERNVPIAMLIFHEAAQHGSVDSLCIMANCLLKGKGIPQDENAGMQYLEEAAEKGHIRASLQLAECLCTGKWVNKDIVRAASVLKKVNDPNAFFMLGNIYQENGEKETAFSHYYKAASENHVQAQYVVALSYATGQGVRRNYEEAKKWLRAAARQGHSEAKQKLEALGEK